MSRRPGRGNDTAAIRRGPQPIAELLSELIHRSGLAAAESAAELEAAWQRAVGETWAAQSRAGDLRRGTLWITASSNLLIQEMTFQKREILAKLNQELGDATVRDLRFRVGKLH